MCPFLSAFANVRSQNSVRAVRIIPEWPMHYTGCLPLHKSFWSSRMNELSAPQDKHFRLAWRFLITPSCFSTFSESDLLLYPSDTPNRPVATTFLLSRSRLIILSSPCLRSNTALVYPRNMLSMTTIHLLWRLTLRSSGYYRTAWMTKSTTRTPASLARIRRTGAYIVPWVFSGSFLVIDDRESW